jgi:hypothetical protein
LDIGRFAKEIDAMMRTVNGDDNLNPVAGEAPKGRNGPSKIRQLGRRQRSHKYDPFGFLGVLGTILGIASLILVPFFWYLFAVGVVEDGLEVICENSCLLVLSTVFLLLGIMVVTNFFWRRNDRIDVHENGFHYQKGKRRISWLWEEIATMRHVAKAEYRGRSRSYYRTYSTYYLRNAAGEEISFEDDIEAARAVALRIEHEMTEIHLPKMKQQVEDGEVLDFAAFQVSSQGLSFWDELIPWQEISSVHTRSQQTGRLIKQRTQVQEFAILRRDYQEPWAVVPVAEVPNYFLFLQLVRELRMDSRRS